MKNHSQHSTLATFCFFLILTFTLICQALFAKIAVQLGLDVEYVKNYVESRIVETLAGAHDVAKKRQA
jgi:hypothetical protein